MEYKNIEAEKASLGSMLLSNEAILESIDNIQPEDYYLSSHRIIYQNILELVQENKAVDIITLTAKLTDKNQLLQIGGATYLTKIIESVPVSQNVEYYNQIILEKAKQRKIWAILEDAKMGKVELDEAVIKISELSIDKKDDVEFKKLLIDTLEVSNKGVAYKFLIPLLNRYLGGGVDKGELITIGAYTSQAKTSLACQLAVDFVKTGSRKVLYCTSEMTELEIARRILANQMPKNIMDIRAGRFAEGEQEAMKTLAEEIGDYWQLKVVKTYNISDIRKVIRKYNPDILFVDYLQNLERMHCRSDYERVSSNIRDIQAITLENELATFVVSQLSRDKREIRPPKINDLRDSGRIEECSNIVILLYWKDRMQLSNKMRVGGELPEELEVLIVKNRDGTIGKFTLDYFPEYALIRERERETIYE